MKQQRVSPIALTSGFFILVLGAIQAIMPMSIDLYLPALPTITRELQVAPGAVQLTVAVFLVGVAVGQLIYGPITDKYGRKVPLFVGLGFYIIGALFCAQADSIELLIGGRFIQALGASAGAVISSAIARDVWSGKMLADRLSLLILVLGVAPVLAPSLGSLILTQWQWHTLFWFLLGYGALIGIAVAMIPETSSMSERAHVRLRDALHTYLTILGNRPFMVFILTGACAIGMLMGYITSSSFIYIDILGVSPREFGLFFGINAIGFVGAAQLNRQLLRRFSLEKVAGTALFGAIGVGIGLIGVSSSGYASPITLTVLFSLLCVTIGFSMPNLAALAFGHIRERMGSASALQGTMQSIIGGVSGALVGLISNGTMLPAVIVITAFAVIGRILLFVALRQRTP